MHFISIIKIVLLTWEKATMTSRPARNSAEPSEAEEGSAAWKKKIEQQRELARLRLEQDEKRIAHISYSVKVFVCLMVALVAFWGVMKWSGVMEEPQRLRPLPSKNRGGQRTMQKPHSQEGKNEL